jgi:pimeloyl-ACP methyl ester carboxylesterase
MNPLVTPPERQATMQLSDSRQFDWFEWGPEDGLPVLFCTGAGMSGWLGFGSTDLKALNLRLLAIDRPGLGLSDPHPHKTLASWVDDIRELIHNYELQPALAVGFSQGAPFALALAEHHLVQAIALVSGQDELSHPSLRPLLHPDVAGMVAAVQQNPVEFEQHFAQIATAEGLWELILSMSGECDQVLYESEPFSTAYQRALQEGFSQGAQGYGRDLVNALSWTVDIENITVPVDLWYGGLDTSTVHSPDFGVTLASRLRYAAHTIDPQAGGSILWTRAGDILLKLRSHVSTY